MGKVPLPPCVAKMVPGTAGVGIFRKEALAAHAKLPTRIGYAKFPLSVVLGRAYLERRLWPPMQNFPPE